LRRAEFDYLLSISNAIYVKISHPDSALAPSVVSVSSLSTETMRVRRRPMRRTKIVCTVGPATSSPEMIRQLVTAGVDVFRINFSHGEVEAHRVEIATIRKCAAESKIQVAILQDLPGPKIRVGKIEGGSVDLVKGSSFTLTSAEIVGNERIASVNYPSLLKSLRKGNILHLADGIIRLRVEETTGDSVTSEVVAGGILSSGKGVNAPGVRMKVDFPTESDASHLKFGVSQGVDFVGLSFVRTATDVRKVRRLLPKKDPPALIVKVEKAEALSNFGSILEVADGVMVARGDLGIEVPIQRVPVIQKEIVRSCNEAGKPVIVATQMLISMVNFPVPSRAEVTDVSTAILDGTDAVMLSDETAVGKYPIESVRMLESIAKATEEVLGSYRRPLEEGETGPTEEGIARAACKLADYTGARAIVAPTQSGSTAARVSKYRPSQPIVALCTQDRVARNLKLRWGITSLVVDQVKTVDALFAKAEDAAVALGHAKKGEPIVVTSGTPGLKGTTDLIKVSIVGR